MYTSQKFAENLFLGYCGVAQVAPQFIMIKTLRFESVVLSKDEANSPGAYIHDNLHIHYLHSIGPNTTALDRRQHEHNNNGACSVIILVVR